ncbi:MAG: alkyl hydroperoxide reductase subunit F [Tannerellaceae bacterium]|jgi:alkyl hydroperoxide reductase subunit F|nr:alkyl hydroperoxide reductase subunit F [Tannerellaceae bacterium]
MLDFETKDQVRNIFASLKGEYIFNATIPPQHESGEELLSLLTDVADCSDKISVLTSGGPALGFALLKNGQDTGIRFRGIPSGHEFSSLLLAVLNCDGLGKNIPDEGICQRITGLKGKIELTTYVSLTCTNCPDVVQTLNLMAILNENIVHEMVDGSLFEEEVNALRIQAVPSVYADGKLIHAGRAGLGELLSKLETIYGSESGTEAKTYNAIVIGAGPSGSTAAIYLARKGLKVALIAERIGGQVKETVGIENFISVPYITGEILATNLKAHLEKYPIDLFEHRIVEKLEEAEDGQKVVSAVGGERWIAPAVIIATGASWRRLNVAGESEYIGRGVAFCPHCDGPFYKGKRVAVVGGGNSGIEAAIDLAGICSEVIVFEFLDELKADDVLQKKARSLSNVQIFLSSQTTEVVGNGEKVSGIRVKNRKTNEERLVDLDGIFVQIGLAPNSSKFREVVSTNRFGEIEVDERCRTNRQGIYAVGDVTTVPYKQIIISMGEGAKGALSAFADLMVGGH